MRIAFVSPLYVSNRSVVPHVEQMISSVRSARHDVSMMLVYNYVAPELNGYRAVSSLANVHHLQGRQPQSVARA